MWNKDNFSCSNNLIIPKDYFTDNQKNNFKYYLDFLNLEVIILLLRFLHVHMFV